MKYCQKCILPETRPNLVIEGDGICNACKTHSTKINIDWDKRVSLFRDVVDNAKKRSKGYDCVIPVSGGKDSHWQVIKCLEYGLNPLAVTWKSPVRTKLGDDNLKNLIELGVDHIDYQVNPKVEKKYMYQALVRYGSTAIPMHMAMFNIPPKIAVKFDIPLIVWGENSAFEYGSVDDEHKGFKLNSAWMKHYGVTHGTTARDWISEELTECELTPYFGANDKELEKAGVLAIFLGYYFSWDVETSLKIAMKKGFKVREEGPKTGYYNYADVDDDFISIHHYLKWYKFGFTRLFDNLSLEIRNGRMTREDAIGIVRERGDDTPHEDIAKLCDFLSIKKEHFFEIIEKFRNPNIWTKSGGSGMWMIKEFIISDWEWI